MKVQHARAIVAATVLLVWHGAAYAPAQERSTRILENERVVIWDVATNTPARPPVPGPVTRVWVALADGRVHVGEERKEATARAILIEVKDVRVARLDAPRGVAPAFPRDGATRVVDNDRITVWDVTWVTGAKTPVHFHDRDVVAVYLGPGTVRSTTPDGTSTAIPRSFGEAVFLPRGRTHVEECIAGPRRDIIIELK